MFATSARCCCADSPKCFLTAAAVCTCAAACLSQTDISDWSDQSICELKRNQSATEKQAQSLLTCFCPCNSIHLLLLIIKMSTTVLQPYVKIIIMIKRLLEIINVMVWVMVTIVNPETKTVLQSSCLVRAGPSTFIKTSYWKLKIWILLIANFDCRWGDGSLPELCTKQMSHMSLTNLTCDQSWVRCMWAAGNTTGLLICTTAARSSCSTHRFILWTSAHCFYHCEK